MDALSLDEIMNESIEIDDSFCDRDRLDRALRRLPERLERIVRLRFGYYGNVCNAPMTCQEIGEELGLTKARIHYLAKKGTQRLQKIMRAQNLVDDCDGHGPVSPLSDWEVDRALQKAAAERSAAAKRDAERRAAEDRISAERQARARRERDARAAMIERAMREQCRQNVLALERGRSNSRPVSARERSIEYRDRPEQAGSNLTQFRKWFTFGLFYFGGEPEIAIGLAVMLAIMWGGSELAA